MNFRTLKSRAVEPEERGPAWERHPLFVEPRVPFTQMSDREWRWWVHQNGELFLARLPWWKRLEPLMGGHPAAAMLKRAHTDEEIWDAYRSRDPDWYPRPTPAKPAAAAEPPAVLPSSVAPAAQAGPGVASEGVGGLS